MVFIILVPGRTGAPGTTGGLVEEGGAEVLLVYGEGYSYRDAAEVLDIPVGTVMSRLAGARKKLAEHFGD